MEILNDIRLKKYKNLLLLFYCWLIATIGIIIFSILIDNIFFIETLIFDLFLLLSLVGIWYMVEKIKEW